MISVCGTIIWLWWLANRVMITVCMVNLSDLERGGEGWRSGENARLPPVWPGFDSRTRRPMWAEFFVGFLLRGPFLEAPSNYRAR